MIRSLSGTKLSTDDQNKLIRLKLKRRLLFYYYQASSFFYLLPAISIYLNYENISKTLQDKFIPNFMLDVVYFQLIVQSFLSYMADVYEFCFKYIRFGFFNRFDVFSARLTFITSFWVMFNLLQSKFHSITYFSGLSISGLSFLSERFVIDRPTKTLWCVLHSMGWHTWLPVACTIVLLNQL